MSEQTHLYPFHVLIFNQNSLIYSLQQNIEKISSKSKFTQSTAESAVVWWEVRYISISHHSLTLTTETTHTTKLT